MIFTGKPVKPTEENKDGSRCDRCQQVGEELLVCTVSLTFKLLNFILVTFRVVKKQFNAQITVNYSIGEFMAWNAKSRDITWNTSLQ